MASNSPDLPSSDPTAPVLAPADTPAAIEPAACAPAPAEDAATPSGSADASDVSETPVAAAELEEAATPTEADGSAAPARTSLGPAECAQALKARFPALFTGAPKPLKLRIQVDIQERAPGVFSRQALSAFFRRYTGSHGYLVAITRAKHRFDLDGQPAGEVTDEHRQAAAEELNRRRGIHEGRIAEEQAQRARRASLLRDFSNTTLSRPNFCALKGVDPEALDGLLEQARREAAEAPPPMVQRDHRPGGRPGQAPGGPGRRPDSRGGARDGGRPLGGPRGEASRAEAPRGTGPQGDGRRGDAPGGEGRRDGPRPPRGPGRPR